MEKARRRRVPAFGEWNYTYYGSADELATPAPVTAAVPFDSYAAYYAAAPAPAELEARSDVWFKYSPPPRKPPPPPVGGRKVRRPAAAADRTTYGGGGGGKRPRAAIAARASSCAGAVAPSSSSVPRTPAKSTGGGTAAARVVLVQRQRVDADLYQVPPPEFVHDQLADFKPRMQRKQQRKKKASSRSRWMGCFGFSCVPAC